MYDYFSLSLTLFLIGTAATGLGEDVRLKLLNGEQKNVDLKSIDVNLSLQVADGQIRLDQLREIRRPEGPKTESNRAIAIDLVGQGRLSADSVTVENDVCLIRGHCLNAEPLRLPLEQVVGFCLKPTMQPKKSQPHSQVLAKEDQLTLQAEDSIESVSGLLESLDENSVTFAWNGKSRTLPRENVIAIKLASLIATNDIDQAYLVHFRDGDTCICSKRIELLDNSLRLEICDECVVSTDWRQVDRIQIRSTKLRYVSDISPASAEHHPILTFQRPFQIDRNVSGGRLRVGNQSFEKGIGVASNSRLVYRLNQEFRHLCGEIGIDQETNGRGNCVFVVRADGREMARIAMQGTDVPRKIQLDVKGVQLMELVVEAGSDLDLADHANWCDLCLLRE